MPNTALLIYVVRKNFTSVAMLFLIILELSIVGVIVFGVRVNCADGVLTEFRFFNHDVMEFGYANFVGMILRSFANVIHYFVVFFFLAGFSNLAYDFLESRKTELLLVRPVTRTGLFASTLSGTAVAVTLNLLLFAMILSGIVSAKTGCVVIGPAVYGSTLFSLELIAYAGITWSLVLLLKSSTWSTGIMMAYYLLVSGMLSSKASPELFGGVVARLVSVLRTILPHSAQLTSLSTDAFFDLMPPFSDVGLEFGRALIFSVLVVAFSIQAFGKREF